MRNLLILILGAAVIWLLIERNRLTDELAAATTEVTEIHKKLEIVEQQIMGPGKRGSTSGPRGSWLDAHIERGARALETAPGEKPAR